MGAQQLSEQYAEEKEEEEEEELFRMGDQQVSEQYAEEEEEEEEEQEEKYKETGGREERGALFLRHLMITSMVIKNRLTNGEKSFYGLSQYYYPNYSHTSVELCKHSGTLLHSCRPTYSTYSHIYIELF